MPIKKIGLPGLFLLFMISVLFSCRRENLSGPSTLADSTALFSASINGTTWQTDSVSGFLSCEYGGKVRIMTITGYTSGRVISISLRDTTTTGSNDSTLAIQTYPVGAPGNASAFAYANNPVAVGRNVVWQQQGTARSGEATVTASDGVNKRISGSFQFSAKLLVVDSVGSLRADTVSITNGVFSNIPYTYFRHD